MNIDKNLDAALAQAQTRYVEAALVYQTEDSDSNYDSLLVSFKQRNNCLDALLTDLARLEADSDKRVQHCIDILNRANNAFPAETASLFNPVSFRLVHLHETERRMQAAQHQVERMI